MEVVCVSAVLICLFMEIFAQTVASMGEATCLWLQIATNLNPCASTLPEKMSL